MTQQGSRPKIARQRPCRSGTAPDILPARFRWLTANKKNLKPQMTRAGPGTQMNTDYLLNPILSLLFQS